jgi:hypothetical protein
MQLLRPPFEARARPHIQPRRRLLGRAHRASLLPCAALTQLEVAPSDREGSISVLPASKPPGSANVYFSTKGCCDNAGGATLAQKPVHPLALTRVLALISIAAFGGAFYKDFEQTAAAAWDQNMMLNSTSDGPGWSVLARTTAPLSGSSQRAVGSSSGQAAGHEGGAHADRQDGRGPVEGKESQELEATPDEEGAEDSAAPDAMMPQADTGPSDAAAASGCRSLLPGTPLNQQAASSSSSTLSVSVKKARSSKVKTGDDLRPAYDPWPDRKRTPRAAKDKTAAAAASKALKKMLGRDKLMKRRLTLGAAEPSASSARVTRPRHDARDAATPRSSEGMAQRLLAGRCVDNCLRLMNMHLLSPARAWNPSCLQPQRGLSAKLDGQDVFVVDVFTRRGLKLADVAPLKKRDCSSWVLGRAETVKQERLEAVGLRFKPLDVKGKEVVFVSVPNQDVDSVLALPDTLAQARSVAAGQKPVSPCNLPQLSRNNALRSVVPASARKHVEQNPGHVTEHRNDKGEIKFMLDLPTPVPIDVRPHRCKTCRTSEECESGNYFVVTIADMRTELMCLFIDLSFLF